MKSKKILGFSFISMGILILLYKRSGFYGWGGYIDKSWENIIISSILVVIGLSIMKGKKTVK